MTLDEAEKRIVALEQAAVPWLAKHWQITAGITFVVGLVAGHLFR